MCLGYGITLKLNEDDTFSYGLLVHAQTYEEGKLLQACVKECEGISL